MSPGSRSLPDRPSLRYLKLEAKRRLAAGEFATLHDAQAAMAREHGLPGWTALKEACVRAGPDDQESHALAQLHWVISRFSGAGEPGWVPPGEAEMREHFDDRLLAVVPAGILAAEITKMAGELRGDPVVITRTPLQALVELAGMRYVATTRAEPPHRLTGLRGYPLGERITDPRATAAGPARVLGTPPPGVTDIADGALAELGLPALVLAGGDPGLPPWVVAQGHADLDRAEAAGPGHWFPASGVTALVTATAVLRLVAAGRLSLDAPANDRLRAVRLADGTITVRELLSHTGGVDNPSRWYADSVPGLADLMGPVISCSGPRGTAVPSNGGYAVLGQLIADVTGTPYASAVTRLVLDPLGLRDSRFPARPADITAGATAGAMAGVTAGATARPAVTGYTVTADGAFTAAPAQVSAIQAAGGLWSTAADLVRLGTGWSSLLPAALAAEAVTAQAGPGPEGHRVGLGWIISPAGDTAVHGGAGIDSVALLRIRLRDHRTHVVLASRQMTVEPVDARLTHGWMAS
jgi:CubicO group peptidase (beta-lactamase class C family)